MSKKRFRNRGREQSAGSLSASVSPPAIATPRSEAPPSQQAQEAARPGKPHEAASPRHVETCPSPAHSEDSPQGESKAKEPVVVEPKSEQRKASSPLPVVATTTKSTTTQTPDEQSTEPTNGPRTDEGAARNEQKADGDRDPAEASPTKLPQTAPPASEPASGLVGKPTVEQLAEPTSRTPGQDLPDASEAFVAGVSQRAESWPPPEPDRHEVPTLRGGEVFSVPGADKSKESKRDESPALAESAADGKKSPLDGATADRPARKGRRKGKSPRPRGEELPPSERRRQDELLDLFFQRGEEVEKEHIAALARAAEPSHSETNLPRVTVVVLTPAQQMRRRKLRRIVLGVVGGAVVLSVLGAFNLARGQRQTDPLVSSSNPVCSTAEAIGSIARQPAPSLSLAPAPTESAAAAAAAAPTASVPEPVVASAAVEPSSSARTQELAAPSASAPAVAIADGVDPKKEAERLLNKGKFKEAIAMAEAAIERDPQDAYPYLFLGSALQSVGRWKDGIAAFSKCVHTAKKGPIQECRAVGGR